MAEFWSDEWFDAVNEAAGSLRTIDGLSFSFDVAVAESANGKVRAHGEVTDGQLRSFVSGQFVPATKGEKANVSFIGKAKRLMPIITGEQPPLVAYMLGELKIEGEYQLVVDNLVNQSDHSALESFRALVAAATG